MYEHVLIFILFSERKKNHKKPNNHPEQVLSAGEKKKMHQNSVTSRRPYLTNLRQQMLLGSKLKPRTIQQDSQEDAKPEVKSWNKVFTIHYLCLIMVTHVS